MKGSVARTKEHHHSHCQFHFISQQWTSIDGFSCFSNFLYDGLYFKVSFGEGQVTCGYFA